jgi:hypothetical protein
MYDNTTVITITDGTGCRWCFETNGDRPDLIGHDYHINGAKAILLDSGYCEMDFHYAGVPGYKRKPPIPKGDEVEINYYHINFYGTYFNVKYNNKSYDIATKYIKLIKKEQ